MLQRTLDQPVFEFDPETGIECIMDPFYIPESRIRVRHDRHIAQQTVEIESVPAQEIDVSHEFGTIAVIKLVLFGLSLDVFLEG